MKAILMFVAGLVMVGQSQATTVECSTKLKGKTQTYQVRVNDQKRLVWFSRSQLVSAPKNSYFGWLSDMLNFGLEGSAKFVAKTGYSMISATNKAESVTIGLSPDLSLGIYTYSDGGSGNGNMQLPMVCHARSQSSSDLIALSR